MRIFFDTEFTGLHAGTTLISIGLISENGKKFYAEFKDYDVKQVDTWIQDNVIDKLWIKQPEWKFPDYYFMADKATIKEHLTKYFEQFDTVELVSDVCHYDMVLLVDIFGTAFDLPKNVCPVCYDINQDMAKFHGVSNAEAFDMNREDFIYNAIGKVYPEEQKHTAIHDAIVIREIYNIINS